MTYLTRPVIFLGQTFWTVLPLVVAIDLVAIYLLVFKERMDPRSFAFWMALVIALPFAGFALYVLYGCTLYSASVFGKKLGGDREIGLLDDPRLKGADLPTGGNDVRFYDAVRSSSEDLVADVRAAEASLHFEIHRLPEDDAAPGLVDALCEKAREGLDVRVLLGSNIPGSVRDVRRLKGAGAKVSTFHRRLLPLFAVSFRFKNRRVLAAIDGRIAYAGEQSIARLEGPAASRLDVRFLADWSFASGEPAGKVEQAAASGDTVVQIVSSGPDSDDSNPAMLGYVAMMKSAKESITLSEPYLVPDENIYNFLKLSALSGIDVRVVVSVIGDHWYQKWNTASAASSLLGSGVRVFFSEADFSDSMLVVDGRRAGISLAPFNGRAMLHDFHTSVLMESERISEQVQERMEGLIRASEELHADDYRHRTVLSRMKIAFSRAMMLFNRGGDARARVPLEMHRRHGGPHTGVRHPGRPDDSGADVPGALRPQVLLRLDDSVHPSPPGGVHTLPVHGAHGVLAHRPVQRPGLLEVQPGRLKGRPGGGH